MILQTSPCLYSIEEYLEHEETAECRSEYHDGEIIPMAGGSINHNRIIRNLSRLLELGLQEQPYEVFLRIYAFGFLVIVNIHIQMFSSFKANPSFKKVARTL